MEDKTNMFAPPTEEENKMVNASAEEDLLFAPPEDFNPLLETKPSGGFLGADLSSLAKTDSKKNLEKTLEALLTGSVEAARNVPIAGPIVEKGALALTGKDPEVFEQEREAANKASPIASTLGGLAGSMAGFAAAPQTLIPQLGLSAGDMLARGKSTEDMALPLVLETSLGGAGKVVSKFKNLQEKMITNAGKRAEAAAGLDMTKTLRKKIANLENTGKIKSGELGNRLLEEGVVKFGDSADDIAIKSRKMNKIAGDEIGKLLANKQTSTQIAKDLLEGKLEGTALSEIQKKINKKINTQIKMLDEAGEKISLKDLNKIKSEIGEEVKDFSSKAPTKKAGKKIYQALKETVESSMGEKELNRLRELNKKYAASKLAGEASESASQNRTSELSKSMALYGAASNNPVLPSVVASKALWNKYGNSLIAAGLKKNSDLGKYVTAFAEAAEKGGQAAVGALHFQLMQNDEQYRKKYGKGE